MTNIPIHPQPGFFNQTIAESGIDYLRIVARPKWSFEEADKRIRKSLSQTRSPEVVKSPHVVQQRARKSTLRRPPAKEPARDGGGAEPISAFVDEQETASGLVDT